MVATTTHATRANSSRCPYRVVGGTEARGLISLIPRSGEDECGPDRAGKAERHPDAWLACGTPDYRSHSFRAARRFSLFHHHSGRASAKRYEERYDREYLETTRDSSALQPSTRSATTALLHPVGPTEQWMLAFMEKPLQ